MFAGIGAPLLFFGLLELGLRLAGFGNSVSFLLPEQIRNQDVFIQNDRFSWRFFGPDLARTPVTFAIPRTKPAGTVRVFVFGESAAYGDPQPAFGLPRMLAALLSQRFPSVHFEVVNAAMTGINSHAVLPIARDCARADGDIWVIYMGNNEVVGPYGSGTVFGPQAPGLALVRSSLALKATRTGQLLDDLTRRLRPPPPERSEWGGMLMFLDQQVRADDPRMATVYHNFERNLNDIIKTGRAAGAGIVVSTVAVNLRDCAPFASQLPPELPEATKVNWRALYSRGNEALAAGQQEEALRCFRQAEQISDRSAELQFILARAALAHGQNADAIRHFSFARDLDTLRFRCDSKLNDITRRVAGDQASERVLFADAEKSFAQQSADGAPGSEFFYEHVHLKLEGNYLLARIIADQVAKLLPEAIRARAASVESWPTLEDCAWRLAWTDSDRLSATSDMLGRLNDPPFTYQLNHIEQVRALTQQAGRFTEGAQTALQRAGAIARDALAASPDDSVLQAQCAKLLEEAGDLPAATKCAWRVTELLPHGKDGWLRLGSVLARQQQFDQAARVFETATRLDPRDVLALQNLAQAYTKLERRDDAIRVYRQALALKPRFGLAYLGLGQLLEQAGQKEEAERNFRLAIQNRIHRAEELAMLARFCQSRGWLAEASTNYLDAIKLKPFDPVLRLSAGDCLSKFGKHEEAEKQAAEAVRLAPDSVPARNLLAVELSENGKQAEAIQQFREVARRAADVFQVHLNLGIALMKGGQNADALGEFREVLRLSPTNALALRYIEALRTNAPGGL